MKNFLKQYWILVIPIAILITALLFLFRSTNQGEDKVLVGMVDAEFVDIAAEYPGKIDSLYVKVGDTVRKGQLLAIVHSSAINNVQNQALAGITVAKEQLKLLQNGTRDEIVGAANNIVKIADEQYQLFSKTYDRMQRLYKDEVISGQERDIIKFRLEASKKELETAKLNLQLLQKGVSPEVVNSAAAIVKQAEEAYALTKTIGENTRIVAPQDGIINSIIIEAGEMASIGYPIISLQKLNSLFIRFNLRQDYSEQLQTGQTLQVEVPGCEPTRFPVHVEQIAPSLTFANWVPIKEKGKFELRTFTVEVKPATEVKGLRAGMTAALQQ